MLEELKRLRAECLPTISWIACADQLPSSEETVLVFNAVWGEHAVWMGYHTPHGWTSVCGAALTGSPDSAPTLIPPTHWSPVPLAPPMPEKRWRVGQRTGQERWQIKEAPGWKVRHDCASLHDAARWLALQGVDLRAVDVVSCVPWRPLIEFTASSVT